MDARTAYTTAGEDISSYAGDSHVERAVPRAERASEPQSWRSTSCFGVPGLYLRTRRWCSRIWTLTRGTPSSLRWRRERRPPGGPIVIDTDVFGADLVPGSALWARYEPIVDGRPAFISFQTVAALRFGALRRR
jgi:hypothetical protein